jgi:hypothetical protein
MSFGIAFAKGCNGRAIRTTTLRTKPFAAFMVPELYAAWDEVKRQNITYYYGDHAYFGRRVYFRCTKNAVQHDCSGESNSHRFQALGVNIKHWTSGSTILLCPQSDIFHNLQGVPKGQWINKTITELRKHTDRPILVRDKARGMTTEAQFRSNLKNIHAVVVFTSIAGVQAALEGIPCFATHDCASAKFGTTDLSLIENPVKPENRYEMASVLADNQWTLQEIEQGMAWQSLQ